MFPSGLGLSAIDQARIKLMDSQRFKIDIESGQLSAEEARRSRYANAEYSNEVTLLEEAAPKKPEGKANKGGGAKNEAELEDDDEKPPTKDAIRQDAMNLDELATVTQKDLDDARAAWEANPPDRSFDGILGAE
jgi:hypothetical protein